MTITDALALGFGFGLGFVGASVLVYGFILGAGAALVAAVEYWRER